MTEQQEMFKLLEFIIDFDSELEHSEITLSDFTSNELMNEFQKYKEMNKPKAKRKAKKIKKVKKVKKLTNYNLFCKEQRLEGYDFKECSLLWKELTLKEKNEYKDKVNEINENNVFVIKTKTKKKLHLEELKLYFNILKENKKFNI